MTNVTNIFVLSRCLIVLFFNSSWKMSIGLLIYLCIYLFTVGLGIGYRTLHTCEANWFFTDWTTSQATSTIFFLFLKFTSHVDHWSSFWLPPPTILPPISTSHLLWEGGDTPGYSPILATLPFQMSFLWKNPISVMAKDTETVCLYTWFLKVSWTHVYHVQAQSVWKGSTCFSTCYSHFLKLWTHFSRDSCCIG